MGCGASKTTAVEPPLSNGTVLVSSAPSASKVKPPIAFEVPSDDVDDNDSKASIIKSHPPKRLRRLEDDQPELSQEEINRRQVEAEERRKAILQMRVQSARLSTGKGPKRRPSHQINEEEEFMDLE